MSEHGIGEPRAPAAVQDALPAGARLAEFEVIRVLGIGGFGIVYLALDHALLRYVAIKEYMPFALAARGAGTLITIRSASHAETFALGLQSFINEARLLAGFDHPSLVKVHRFWEAHGTAYMVMQYYPGRTLKDERRAMQRAPDEVWLRGVVDPLLGALELLHCDGVYHRDIAPDNILLLPDGRPVLLDFGAARRVIGNHTQTLTAILKPNFAPIEQYADVAGMRQGPWTDLYALGAVIRFMITAQAPTPAAARAVQDDMGALSAPDQALPLGMSSTFLAAIDWALAVRPQDRPQSVQALHDALNGATMAPRQPPPLVPPTSVRQASRRAKWASTTPLGQRAGWFARRFPFTIQIAALGRLLEQVLAGRGSRTMAGIGLLALATVAGAMWANNEPVVAAAIELAQDPTRQPGTVAATAGAAAIEAIPMPLRASEPVRNPRRKRADGAPLARAEAAMLAISATSAPSRQSVAAQTPRQVCGDRTIFSLAVCMSRECRTAHFQQHPQCLQLQREETLRQQAQLAR